MMYVYKIVGIILGVVSILYWIKVGVDYEYMPEIFIKIYRKLVYKDELK